ncbi:acetamidase/formamidase family protein [Profundibacterium mesophilum]|uniref:Formamidase n=1 Tax=Profundibacterium mesophilum KAUST100406-0324 TaxID=1037889 RepID=A0A921TGK2_9RHOB|nr:acetamidase/formamidase family protein [Profundibacterium mesophilum]KAF0677519.1 formamidase [Profundibacterium mesophilum KAUST100406-0324]
MPDGNAPATTSPRRSIVVQEFTNSVLDPNQPMLGPVQDGGTIIANTAPGCWGPMITPRLRGGHEVTRPVFVEGAEIGDGVAIRIRDITVTSSATASGHDSSPEGFCLGDPYVAARCPECDTVWPETHIEGSGGKSVRCDACGNPVTPFEIVHGYTVAFDDTRNVGLTLPRKAADAIAERAEHYAALPDGSRQHSILHYAPSDMPGTLVRMRPFMGQLGSCPSMPMPDSHNAGDFGAFLVGAPHDYAITPEELAEHKTDGHMDIDAVRAGAILIAPVKVRGAGIYMGDMHAAQGDGEIAGHTMDVSGSVTLQVEVVKDYPLDGPVLFPLEEDLPPLARPFSAAELAKGQRLAERWSTGKIAPLAPISVIGTAANLNDAIENGLARAARLLDMTVAEVRNRATVNGAIEIGRAPGVIQVTFLVPLDRLDAVKLGDYAREQYGL